ncbi:hypothetical protein DN545_41960, partial [Burkholderia multivorans]
DGGAPLVAGGGDADAEELDHALEEHWDMLCVPGGVLRAWSSLVSVPCWSRNLVRRGPGTGEVCQDG